jgi:ribosome-interacting GTPase 1
MGTDYSLKLSQILEAWREFRQERQNMTEPSYEELKARLSQLEKEVETKKRSGDLIFKVGEKGGVSVYGLGRFPVTLYYEQWNRLLGAAEDLKTFMEENKSRLKLKEQG